MTKKTNILIAALLIAACGIINAGVANNKTQAVNLSARGHVGNGDDVLIGGFIIGGRDFVTMIIRAIGPSLDAYGLAGKTLADPQLTVYDGDGTVIATQDSFLELNSKDLSTLSDSGLRPSDPRECAVILSREPGTRTTAIVRGKNGATGLALVEAYKIE